MTDLGKETISSWEGQSQSRETPSIIQDSKLKVYIVFTSEEFINLGVKCLSIEMVEKMKVTWLPRI